LRFSSLQNNEGDRRFSSPLTYFFLVLPFGISSGFLSVTLPFIFTRAGVPVATTAAVMAIGTSAVVWRFLWAPPVDLSLSTHVWYVTGLVGSAATLLVVVLVPPVPGLLLTSVVFVSQVAATLLTLPVAGMIAHTVAEERKGMASGWYQAGSLCGTGVAGGGGVWLVTHSGTVMAGAVLAVSMLICSVALFYIPNVRPMSRSRIVERWRFFWSEFLEMVKSPMTLLVMALTSSPIGAGGAAQLWSAVAPDWRAGPNTVALVTGVLSGVLSAVGCVVGGWSCDRLGRFWAFFGSGTLLGAVAILLAAVPRTPQIYSAGVLGYAVVMGFAYSAFTALILSAIGKGAATAKYAIVNSLGNVPVLYMTASDGWAHDRWGVGGMLYWEGLLGLAAVSIGLVALSRVKKRSARVGASRIELIASS
jgi:predicted MFS family arabinose efflux permease